MAIQYYLYISDEKLDMLYNQIPEPALKRLAREATIDLKVVKLSLKNEPTHANRYGRLSVVERHVALHTQITGLDQQPGPWIKAKIPLRWTESKGAVFFAGRRGINFVGMVGSMRHVLGAQPDGTTVRGTAASILQLYADRYEPNVPNGKSLEFVEDLVEGMAGGEHRMEFLARTIDCKPSARSIGHRVVFATPLYVALSG